MTADERTGTSKSPPPRIEPRIPERPSMNHVRPDLEGHCHVLRARLGSKPSCVREQRLVGANLDQERRQAQEIRKERRDAGIGGFDRAEIGVGKFTEIASVDDRIDAVLEGGRDGSLKQTKGTLLNSKRTEYLGYPAIEFAADVPQGTTLQRAYLIDSRMYYLMVGGVKPLQEEEADQFFSSFKLTRL